MTIKDCIDIVDNLKPNQYTIKDKVMWLSFIEEIIINEVLKTHEGYDGRYDDFSGYSEDKISVTLIVPSPYDRLYTAYLKMKIDESNGETARYNNSAILYNTYMAEYRKYYNKTHMPLGNGKKDMIPPKKSNVGISDAEYENIKRDVLSELTEKLFAMTSDDKLYDIVNFFVQNNTEMLKGKDGRDGRDGRDGHTPQKNIDYFDGEKGKAFTYDDFTPEQLSALKGEKGDKGDKGDQGVRGLQGIQGLKGDKGDQGYKGDIGPKGDRGEPFTYEDFTPEQLEGLKPVNGVDYNTPEDKAKMKEYIDGLFAIYVPTRSYVNILGGSDNWVAEGVTDSSGNVIGSRYGQVVNVNNAVITKNSKVDLQITSEQMVIFYEKDIAFVAENEGGVVTIYCIGNIPENDYTIQATVTEVTTNG